MLEKTYLYEKGASYRSFFICPIKHPNGYTYRCFCPQNGPATQLGGGLFASIEEALEAGKRYLDRELQYRNELNYYRELLEQSAISKEEYYKSKSSLEQVIWSVT